MVQLYSLGGASVPSHEGTWAQPGKYNLTYASLGPPKSTTQTANRSVQPFLHSSRQSVGHVLFPCNCPFAWGIWAPSNTIPWAHLSPQPKQHLDRFSHFSTDDRRVSLCFTVGCRSSSKLPLLMGWYGPHVIHGPLGPPESSTQTTSGSLQLFCRVD